MSYDVVFVGAGPGGYVGAIKAAQLGLKTCCIEERKELGGTCLNVGCIPSKALLHSTEVLQKVRGEEGIVCPNLSFDFAKIMERKERIVQGFTGGIEALFQKNKLTRIHGKAKLISSNTLSVGSEKIEAKWIVLATGSSPISLPFLPFDEQKVLSSTGALALKSVPKKLGCIGAGVIGVELGSVYHRLGSEVHYIEFLDRICPNFDLSLSQELLKILSEEKMTFSLSHKVVSATVAGEQVTLQVEGPQGKMSLSFDAVMVSIGRKPYTEGLGLDEVGVKRDAKGFILINSSFQTSVPNIFAVGDVVGGVMLAHKASDEAIAVAELLAGKSPMVDYFSIPSVAYTHPEVASVGLTEEECKSKKIGYKAAKFPFKANSRARCIGEEKGFVKILMEEKSQKLLGIHILGQSASELIAEASLALFSRMDVSRLVESCHAHPTLSEAVREAAMALQFKALHS